MSSENIPDIWLHRYLLGELPDAEMERVREAVNADATVQQRLHTLQRASEEILLRYPTELMAGKIQELLEEAVPPAPKETFLSARIFSPLTLGLVAALLVAALGVQVFWSTAPEVTQTPEENIRIKGGELRLSIFRKTPDGIEELKTGSRVAEKDVIQLSYQVAGQKYGVIMSRDGRGIITQHLPEQGDRAADLLPGRNVPLSSAYKLDDAPKAEVFFFVTADRRFPISVVRDAIAQSGADWNRNRRLLLPSGYQQVVVQLEKETKR